MIKRLPRRFPRPTSLLGQVLVWSALALLVAQAVSTALILSASGQRREEGLLNAAAFRFVAAYERTQPGAQEKPTARPDRIVLHPERPGSQREQNDDERRARRGRDRRLHWIDRLPRALETERDSARETRLAEILRRQGVPVTAVHIASFDTVRAPRFRRGAMTEPRTGPVRARRPDEPPRLLVVAIRLPGEDRWLASRVPQFPRPRGTLTAVLLQTAIIYVLLMGGLAFVLRRATRPLANLTAQLERFGRAPDRPAPLEPAGPDDVRRLIAAHNAMERRIAALLDEKDVMLGAIGHDLKTPLAALRVRIESVADEGQRARMAAGIEDIARSLDDILSLARVGRADGPPEATRLAALTAGVVEEFEDMGEPVTLLDAAPLTRRIHVTWLRRALRNLIANAVRYGGAARVTLLEDAGSAVLRVEDDGPGIPEDRIDAMLEPFARGEASRNRDTGGAGLGLALARAIAEQHGGRLTLRNRAEGGLCAEIRLPRPES